MPQSNENLGDMNIGIEDNAGENANASTSLSNPGEEVGERSRTAQPQQNMQPQNTQTPPQADPTKVEVDKGEWEQMQGTVSQMQREKFFNDTMGELKAEFPDFDKNQVVAKLKEINEKDPAKAQSLNTPVGFRMLWLEIEKNKAGNDPVNNGSSKGGGSDFSTFFKGAMDDQEGSLRKAIDLSL